VDWRCRAAGGVLINSLGFVYVHWPIGDDDGGATANSAVAGAAAAGMDVPGCDDTPMACIAMDRLCKPILGRTSSGNVMVPFRRVLLRTAVAMCPGKLWRTGVASAQSELRTA
jgi:hypothetical protein